MFIADSTGLDFLNSIGTPEDTIVEWLADGEDLLAWLQEAKLVDPADAAAIRSKAFPGELDEVAAQARALRDWFRDFVHKHMGRPLTAKALDLLEPLNRVKALTESVQRPIAVACIQEAAPKPAWRSKPSWFLIAEEDRMISPKTQHFMAERMGAKVRVHPVDDTPLLTAPELVVDILLEAAREVLTR
jgi:pimeloyl-ACP methyl ester carboxylesterase